MPFRQAHCNALAIFATNLQCQGLAVKSIAMHSEIVDTNFAIFRSWLGRQEHCSAFADSRFELFSVCRCLCHQEPSNAFAHICYKLCSVKLLPSQHCNSFTDSCYENYRVCFRQEHCSAFANCCYELCSVHVCIAGCPEAITQSGHRLCNVLQLPPIALQRVRT